MDRLGKRFANVKKMKSKALVTFITAGDPDLATTVEMVHLLEEAGADIIELGMPFSDPIADGPTIQLSSERALASGTTLEGILAAVRAVRETSSVPIILMGYLNPINSYGFERFASDAVNAGVDGVLLVDMPPEESREFLHHAKAPGLKVIFLLAPTSDDSRIATVAKLGNGFIYYVTITGVTGVRKEVSSTLAAALQKIRKKIKLPIVAGFGISNPGQAAEVAELADGIVIGSAIVKLFEQYSGEKLKSEVRHFVNSIKIAISTR